VQGRAAHACRTKLNGTAKRLSTTYGSAARTLLKQSFHLLPAHHVLRCALRELLKGLTAAESRPHHVDGIEDRH
jgi:hypothetical protein